MPIAHHLNMQGESSMDRIAQTQIPAVKAKLLDGKRGLIVGIANENSIAWGCAKAFRAFGAELAVTYLNDKAKKYVEPLARELEAPIVMPLDVRTAGQMEAVFERVANDWGNLDFVVHSIAFSPKDALQGRVVDVSCDGFLTTMEVSCWTFIRMAHLAEPLMRKGGTLFTMTYYGSHLAGPAGDPRRLRHSGIRYPAGQGEGESTGTEPRQRRRRGRCHRVPRSRCRSADHRRDTLRRRRLSHHRLARGRRLARLTIVGTRRQ
jgi:NAD(P)-dependent dehydrogenase (short-subunit alcohol dehydrogenase family)